MSFLVQNAQIIPVHNVTPGLDLNTAALTGDRVNMENHNHCTMVLHTADVAAVVTYTIQEHTAATGGTSANLVQITSYWRKSANTNLDAVGVFARVDQAAAATAVTITGETGIVIIEIDAAQMTAGSPFLSVNGSDPALACVFSGFYILSETRYAQDIIVSAIA